MTGTRLSRQLLAWYDQNRRQLPWRDDPSPYHVWLSEIMLQQTRVSAVREYYTRFLSALPTIESLAKADEDLYLKLWEGLGYYSRVRNLHKAAGIVMERHGGRLPADRSALRALPGIGDYTAGAVASIAFGLPEPAVDGNVLRICARLSCCDDSVGDERVKRMFREELRDRYPPDRCGDFTSAVMELGETVCVPGTPDCPACPLAGMCGANRTGRQTDYPVMPEKKPRKIQKKTVFLLVCGDRAALRKRPDRGLLAGLWEFPNTEGILTPAQAAETAARWGCEPLSTEPCGGAIHIFTHLEWHMEGYLIRCGVAPERFVWAAPADRRERYAVPAAFRAYKNILESHIPERRTK